MHTASRHGTSSLASLLKDDEESLFVRFQFVFSGLVMISSC